MPRTTEIPKQVCPWCESMINGATGLFRDSTPHVGDATICFRCNSILLVGDDLRLRKPTDAEMLILGSDPRIINIQFLRLAPDMPPLRPIKK